MAGSVLLSDADCGVCRRAAGVVPRIRLKSQVRAVQDAALRILGVDPRRATPELPFLLAAALERPSLDPDAR